ncbi:UNVERIFIED_CONTAM: hypothetical protein FKN15_031212 [Acipenser sinensis]
MEARMSTELSDRIQGLEREVARHRDEASNAQAEVHRLLEILREMENEKNDKDKKITELERDGEQRYVMSSSSSTSENSGAGAQKKGAASYRERGEEVRRPSPPAVVALPEMCHPAVCLSATSGATGGGPCLAVSISSDGSAAASVATGSMSAAGTAQAGGACLGTVATSADGIVSVSIAAASVAMGSVSTAGDFPMGPWMPGPGL